MKKPLYNPPNRGHLHTEQRLAESAALDALTVEQTVRLINTQDMTVALAVRGAIPAITDLVEQLVHGMRQGGRLIYLGAGTSGRLGVLDASECPPTFFSNPDQVVGIIAGGDTALRKSSEGKEDDENGAQPALENLHLNSNDLVLGIAAGGTTPYVWGALRYAKECDATTAMICCVPLKSLMHRPKAPVVAPNEPISVPPPPSLPAEIDYPVELLVGPEVVTGSTRMKAGTATKLALNMITTAAMVQLGKTWGNLMVDVRATNAKLRDRALRILTTQCKMEREQAGELLDKADGKVKTALVMAKLGTDAAKAEKMIEEHQGHIRPLIGPPR